MYEQFASSEAFTVGLLKVFCGNVLFRFIYCHTFYAWVKIDIINPCKKDQF